MRARQDRTSFRIVGLTAAVMLALPVAGLPGASSIFDDDWKPPPESARPARPAAPTKPPDEPSSAPPRLPPRPAAPPEVSVAKPPVGPANPNTPAVPVKPAGLRVPGPAALAAAEKTVKEVFKTEYARKLPLEQIAFARTLLGESQQTKDDPASLYVLLREARDLAAAAGEPEVALEAARDLRDNFRIDALTAKEMEQSTLTSAIKVMAVAPATIATYEVAHRAGDLAMEMAEWDLSEGDYAGAVQMSAVAETAARKTLDWEYPGRVHGRAAWLAAADAEYEPNKALFSSLKSNPADPAANLAVGRFDFVYLDRPVLALPLLARGADEILKALALRDQAAAAASTPSATQLSAVADAWADAAKNQPAAIKDAMQRRALFLYDQAFPLSKGLDQVALQKRSRDLRLSRVQKGLTAEFFRGESLTSRVLTRTDSNIEYRWTGMSPDRSIANDRFSVRWTGWLKASPGAYKLVAIHDDGVRVWVDGQIAIDSWNAVGKTSADVQLIGGMQSLKVEYQQLTGESYIGVGWIVPGNAKPAAIPNSALFHEPIPPGPVTEPFLRPSPDGRIEAPAAKAVSHGAPMSYSDQENCLGWWDDENDWISWDLYAREGDYTVNLEFSSGSKAATYIVTVGSNRLSGVTSDTGGWNSYRTIELGNVHLGTGLHSMRIRATSRPASGLMNVRKVTLIPAGTSG